MPHTLGFASPLALQFHFDKHVTVQREFAFATAQEYLDAADEFLARRSPGPRYAGVR